MPLRVELVDSAVSFLQDPSVANAPTEKRIAFLESKGLTAEEVNAALHKASQTGGVAPQQPPPGAPYPYSSVPPSYGPYGGYWQQPPELPKRDWRDWFIMATVMGGVGFGLYVTAKRYILPLISPPTPEQLTTDKAAIDSSFAQAFASLDQLTTDTASLKDAEAARTARLDAALAELEQVVASLKTSDRKRDDDARRNADELRALRDLVPKAIEASKTQTETRVRDLVAEIKSLRTLMSSRFAPAPPTANHVAATSTNGAHYPPAAESAPLAAVAPQPATSEDAAPDGLAASVSTTASGSAPVSASRFARIGSKGASIPAWQMAAAAKKDDSETASDDAGDSGAAQVLGA